MSRWLLPASGAAIGILLTAQSAHAAVLTAAIQGSTTVTSATPLTWDITTSDSSPISCQLNHDGTPIGAPVDCAAPTFGVPAQPPGAYTLTVFNADAASVDATTTSVTSEPVNVTPTAPQPTAPTNPSNDRSPTFGLGLPADATGALCTVTAPDATTVVADDPCSDPYAVALGSTAADGAYTLSVVATADGETSSAGQTTYTLDTTAPGPPTVSAPISPGSDRTPTFTISTGAASVTCTATGPNGSVPLTAPCTTTAATLDLSSQLDGDYTLTVVAHDGAGNDSTPATATYTLDTTAPTAPTVTGPSSGSHSDRSPTFTITEPDGDATLTCTVTGPSSVTASPCDTSTTIDLSTAGDGTYSLHVTATDPYGNAITTTVTYTLDTTAPPAPTVTPPTSPTKATHPTVAISDGDPTATLTCVLTGPAGDTVSSGLCPVSGTFDTSSYGDGTYTLQVTATDAAGNASSTTSTTWTRDTTPPPAPAVSAPPALTRQTSLTLSISDSEGGVTLTCLFTGPGGGTLLSGACPAGGVFDTTGHGDGTYTLTVTATDAAGNSSTTTVSWVRDTTAPPPPSVTPPASPTRATHPTVAISDTEPGVVLSCVLTGPGGIDYSGVCPGNGAFDTTGDSDGTYSLVVTATDAAGNTSSTTVAWVQDTIAPPAPDVSTPPALTSSPNLTLSISDTEAGAVLSCVLTASDGTVVFSGLCPSDGTFHTSGATDGRYTLVVTATDAAGNTATTTVQWDRDTTPPPAPTVSTPPSLTNHVSLTLSISDSEGTATLTCGLTGPSGESVFSGACPGNGVFDTTGYGDGTYTLVVTATDAAGNSSTTTVSWVRDTVAPVTPVVTAPLSPARSRAPSFSVTEPESPVTWQCTVTGPSTVRVSVCGLVTTLDLTGAADGTYTVDVIAIDPAGNASLAGSATYVLDTTPPPAPLVSAPPALTKSPSITVTITDAQPDAVLTCVVTSPTGAIVFSGACPVDGTFDTTGYSDGVYQLAVTATDSAGNASTTTVTWRRDTIPPPVPVVGAPASPGNTRAPSFTVTEPESPVTYRCTVTGPSAVTVTACGPIVTLDLNGAADGTYTVSVTATDPAGNESAAGSVSWVLDTTPPPAPVVTAPTSPGNSRSPSFTVSDAEGGVHWLCTVAGPGAASVATCGPTTTLNLSGSPDGTYTVTVSAVDAAGNISAVGTATYTLDTTPPPAPVVTAPPSPSHDLTPTYGISDTESGAQITCVLTGPGGRTVFTGSCPVDGTFDATGFGDGVYTLAVTATDAAGNSSTTTVQWTLDTIPPPAPSVVAPASPAQGRTVTFTVTDAESGVVYTCTVTGPSAATVTSCGASAVVNLVGAADGTYTLTVTATDAADNTSTSTSASYTLDTTAPVAPSVAAPASPAQGRHPTFTIGGIEAGGQLTCTLTGPAGSTATLTGPCGTSNGVDLTGQPDGTYTLRVTVTDVAGNVSNAGTASYTLDTTPPAAPVIGGHASPGNDTNPSFNISTESGATLTCTVARYFQIVESGPCGPGGTVNLSGFEDGEFEITVFATDAAGNVGPSTTVVYVLDTTPPSAPVLTPPASPSPVERPVWVFTAEDGTTATCTITAAGGQIVQGPVACLSPFTGQFKNLPDGTYVITVVVTDDAGNTSAPAISVFILDRHAPVPPTVLPPDSPGNSHHPGWTISAPKGATLTCTLMRGKDVVYGPGACPADGEFSLAGMPDGTYTLRVNATDSAGNVSATSVTTYVLDTSRPATPDLSYSSGGGSTDTHPYWGFTLPAGTVGRCDLLRDGVLLATKSNCKGAVSFDLTGRPAGAYTLRVYAIDAAGNVSHALVASYVLGRAITPPPGSPSAGSSGGNPFGFGGGGGHHGGGSGGALGPKQIEQALQQFNSVTAPARNVVKKAVHEAHHVASSILPVIHDKVTKQVSQAVQGVVNAVSHAGGGAGFPLLLLVVVGVFLLMQNRIDRRDPKLALASVAADDRVEFRPPPSRGAGA